MYFAPPTCPQGKILTKSDPTFQAVMTSVGVSAPASITFPSREANSTVGRFNPGLTRNSAPASTQRRAVSASRTVHFDRTGHCHGDPHDGNPTSTNRLGSEQRFRCRRYSYHRHHPNFHDSIPNLLFIHGTVLCSTKSSRDARTLSFHHADHFLQSHHARVARCGHRARRRIRTSNVRVVAIRRSPGSSRSITSP